MLTTLFATRINQAAKPTALERNAIYSALIVDAVARPSTKPARKGEDQ